MSINHLVVTRQKNDFKLQAEIVNNLSLWLTMQHISYIILRPIHRMRFVVTTCSIQLIPHCVNEKIAPTSVKEVKETRLPLHVGPTSCYNK